MDKEEVIKLLESLAYEQDVIGHVNYVPFVSKKKIIDADTAINIVKMIKESKD